MATMKMKQETVVSPEGDYIRVYAAAHPNDPLELSGDELMAFKYSELADSVMDEVEFHELDHVGALEIAAKFEGVATLIRNYIADLQQQARDPKDKGWDVT